MAKRHFATLPGTDGVTISGLTRTVGENGVKFAKLHLSEGDFFTVISSSFGTCIFWTDEGIGNNYVSDTVSPTRFVGLGPKSFSGALVELSESGYKDILNAKRDYFVSSMRPEDHAVYMAAYKKIVMKEILLRSLRVEVTK